MLLPFVRLVIGFLLLLTSGAFMAGVARIHMAVLSFLGLGLLVSLQFFESEYKKASNKIQAADRGGHTSNATASTTTSTTTTGGKAAKTD